jgi:uncharacterized protein YbjT (DUF2867 family)
MLYNYFQFLELFHLQILNDQFMKYVITGGAGHISKPLALKLLEAGHEVTVIGRNADHLRELTDKGAKAAIGSVEDIAFLQKTFGGADAVYTMVPPNFAVSNMKEYIGQIGTNYAAVIKATGIKYVVNLSSIGAHLREGAGPINGLYIVEHAMNELDANVLHLRPAYFYYNFLSQTPMIKNMNVMGSNFGRESKFIMADPGDIAEEAAEALIRLDFKGKEVRYIASDERSVREIASILGAAIGKPDLKWTVFTDEQAVGGMIQAGLPEEIAKNYGEMGHALNTGEIESDYWQHRPQLRKRKLEDFAREFADAYNQN